MNSTSNNNFPANADKYLGKVDDNFLKQSGLAGKHSNCVFNYKYRFYFFKGDWCFNAEKKEYTFIIDRFHNFGKDEAAWKEYVDRMSVYY